MKRFKMNFTKTIYVLLAATAILTLAGAVFDFLVLIEAGDLKNTSPAVSATAMGACLIVCAMSASMLFGCCYYFKNDRFYVNYGFFPQYVEVAQITEIKHNLDTNEVFFIFNDLTSKLPDKIGVVKANVKQDEVNAFLDEAKLKMPKVLYTTFTKSDLNA